MRCRTDPAPAGSNSRVPGPSSPGPAQSLVAHPRSSCRAAPVLRLARRPPTAAERPTLSGGPERLAMRCVFCAIRDGQLPALSVAENERAFAILDINPINDGHTLIVPRTHAATLFDIVEEDAAATMRLAHRGASGIRHGLRPDGLNLLQNNGA
ncbi:MAG: HIT domain-containing protein, partial [Zetaproteobacteria bacterium]